MDLVYELPPEAPIPKELSGEAWAGREIQDGEELRMIWEGDDALDCANACRQLQSGDIPYKLNQRVAARRANMEFEREYKIQVRGKDYAKAREVFGYIDEAEEEAMKEAEASGALELPAEIDDPPVVSIQGDWNATSWFPEDATVEVWSGSTKKNGSIVEMSLKENRINYRVDLEGEEQKKVFVLPEDETQAREIVREIVEGAPPE